jgi:hypothetical protein
VMRMDASRERLYPPEITAAEAFGPYLGCVFTARFFPSRGCQRAP